MGAPFSRRQFLASLSALGATLSFPALASATQVNRSWAALLRSPWYFEVEEYGTIVEPEGKQPSIRSDVYDIELGFIKAPRDLIDEVQSHDELRSHFCGLAADHREELVEAIEEQEDVAIWLQRNKFINPYGMPIASANATIIIASRCRNKPKAFAKRTICKPAKLTSRTATTAKLTSRTVTMAVSASLSM